MGMDLVLIELLYLDALHMVGAFGGIDGDASTILWAMGR